MDHSAKETRVILSAALRRGFSILLLLLLLICPAWPQSVPLKRASFIPQWLPQAQFAGYYVALEKGMYRAHGIDLTILKSGPDATATKLLENGTAQFAGMQLTTGIMKRAEGKPYVNIAQIVQRSGMMFVARRSSGILTPRDMEGKRLGLWEDTNSTAESRAFLKKYNLKVKAVPQSATVNLFLRGGVDVASAMWYNEYHMILNSGYNPGELVTFFFAENGLNFPQDGIYTMESTWKRDPELCRAFVKASIEGWRYSFDYPDEALDIVLKYMQEVHANTNRMHQKWMLERIRDLILDGKGYDSLGLLSPERYAAAANTLREAGVIKTVPPFASFYHDLTGKHGH